MKRLRGRAEFARSFLNIIPRKLRVGSAHTAMAAGVAAVAFCSGAAAQDAKGIGGAHQGRHLGDRRQFDSSQRSDVERLADDRPRLR